MRTFWFVVCMVCLGVSALAQAKKTKAPLKKANTVLPVSKERLVEISTNYGTMVVKLSDSTPKHRDNFIKLVKQGFYDSLLFHRIIEGFMIQGGDPNSKNALDSVQLGMGEVPGERIPAEFKPNLFHKKGALAAARDDNVEKASSTCQFYIVQGQVSDDININLNECRIREINPAFSYTIPQRQFYKSIGGSPSLDQNYTVFGEVIKGIEVIDKIIVVPRDANDRPLKNVRMKMRLLN